MREENVLGIRVSVGTPEWPKDERRIMGRVIPGTIREFRQQIPESFANTIRQMRANGDSTQLNATLAAAHQAKWTSAALGRALGITGESVGIRIRNAKTGVAVPPIPEPPRHGRRRRPSVRRERPQLTPAQIAELQEMQKIAQTVRGGMAPGHPVRLIAEQYAAKLDALKKTGVMMVDVDRALGLTRGTTSYRLARHGYSRKSKLPQHLRYRNIQTRRGRRQ